MRRKIKKQIALIPKMGFTLKCVPRGLSAIMYDTHGQASAKVSDQAVFGGREYFSPSTVADDIWENPCHDSSGFLQSEALSARVADL